MLNIYCGTEQTDREKFIFDHIKGKTLLLVPDQFSLQAERDAFFYMQQTSLMDLRIVDFSSLGGKVVHQTGGARPELIDKYGRHMLLTGIIDEWEEKLQVYKGMKWKNSFTEMVNSMISEMKRYDVTPEELENTISSLKDDAYLKYKLDDIVTIYKAYQEKIEGKYLDSEDYISFYGEKMLQADMIHESEIWIYGFDTFTPKNLQIIDRLVRASRGVSVMLTYEKNKEIFGLTRHIMDKLKETAAGAGSECAVYFIGGIRRKSVWDRLGQEPDEDDIRPVTLVEASDMYAEADRAAAFILELVRDKGLRYRDIVVVCNDTDIRGSILRRTFIRWGIPVFMDRKRKVLHHQAVSFILAFMEVTAYGYRDTAVMKMIKSSVMGFGEDEKELLENYIRQFRIRGTMWKREFVKTADTYDEEMMETVNRLRKTTVDCIEEAKTMMGKRNTAGEKIRGLYSFLEEKMDITGRLKTVIKRQEELGLNESAAETAQSWGIVCGIFDQIIEIAGDEKISNEELLKLMESGFGQVEIGLVPVSPDCVIIGTLQRTRHSRLKALLITGANEGVLPMDRTDEGLLNDREKELLQSMDIEISKRDEIVRQEEKLAVHRTFYLPEEYIYISCCAAGEDGAETRPSEVFLQVRDALRDSGRYEDCVSYKGDLSDSDDFRERVTSQKGTLSYAAQALRDCRDGNDIDSRWFQVMNWYEDSGNEDYIRLKKGMLFDNRAEALGGEFADSLYRGDRRALEVSASRLEQYSKCPFSHFIMYGLRADEARVYEMGAREIGDAYHRCLMRFSRELTPDPESGTGVNDPDSLWMSISRDECYERVSRILREDAAGYREGVMMAGKEEEYRTERLSDICGRLAWSLVGQVRKGNISSMSFEHPFGAGRTLPPVTVEAGGRKVLIRGTIDRLDILEGEAVRIIDYKTGKDTIDPEYFSKGYKLQLMIYLQAALDSKHGEAEPAGVFYFRIKDIDMDADTVSVPDTREGIETKIDDAYRLEGIMIDDDGLISSMDCDIDGTSHVIPVKVNRTKGGYAAAAGGFLMSREEFGELYEQVDLQVKRICGEICDGRIDIRPKREMKKDRDGSYRTACRYCRYSSICMFDTAFDGCGYDIV